MSDTLTGEGLETLLEDDPTRAQRLLEELHPEDVADVVDELSAERAGELLMQLPADYAAQVFERLDEERQEAVAETLGVESTAKLALEMDADDRADFISLMPPAMTEPLMQQLSSADPEIVKDIEELRRWPETSAGGLMTTGYIQVSPELTMAEVIAIVRESAVDAETLDALYVVDDEERLLGLLTIRRILLAGQGERVEEVMLRGVKSVEPELDQEDVARKLAKYDLVTMPVVDASGVLLGVITADDVLDVLVDEYSEDAHKMGAIAPLVDGYLETGFWVFFRKRLPWLLVLFLGGFLATQAMQSFDRELSLVTHLAFYLPLLISAGGNSGSQSSTLVIRGLALGEVSGTHWHKVLLRELLLGLSMGVVLALFGMGRVLLAGDGLEFAVLVGVTVIAIVVLGCVVGGMAPLLLRRLGVDPATSSTPLIASLVDVLGIVVYLLLARALLSGLQGLGPA